MRIHKLAGIDIGSNSVRLLVSNVLKGEEETLLKKSSLTRLPIRLGPDAFGQGEISSLNRRKLISGMKAYRQIMEVHGVERYRACATSALREATNGVQVVEEIYAETGINIELISGKEEARIIFSAEMIAGLQEHAESFMYIDVGGGSTELTLFDQRKIVASRSFKIGTIRLLKEQVKKKRWAEMQEWIEIHTAPFPDLIMVGSGGNINRSFKLAEKRAGELLAYRYLKELREDLLHYEMEERMIRFDLNPDRADVLPHALKIYTAAMKWAGAKRMLVPKKGLADGIVRQLYRDYIA